MARRRQSGSSAAAAGAAGIRRSHYRQYGVSNANQILLALIVTALLFFALLRPRWLVFDADVAAGLWNIVVPADIAPKSAPANSSVSVSWRSFCDPAKRNFTLPLADGIPQPIPLNDATTLCREIAGYVLLPEILRTLTATAISFAMLTLVSALYLQLGRPSRSQIFYFGWLPAFALFVAAVLGMVALILWQSYYGAFDNSDCVAVAIAATAIAYLVAVSMVIRWRWPGICAVPTEQHEAQSRRRSRFGPPPRSLATASTASGVAAPPHSASTGSRTVSHAPLESIVVDSTDTAPRATTFHAMNN